jgi:hypothetical protein
MKAGVFPSIVGWFASRSSSLSAAVWPFQRRGVTTGHTSSQWRPISGASASERFSSPPVHPHYQNDHGTIFAKKYFVWRREKKKQEDHQGRSFSFTMMNGQSRLADRERVKRYAEATGQKQYDVQDSVDGRDYSQRNGKQATLFRENTGQHYPGFADAESKKPVTGPVKFVKPQLTKRRALVVTKKMN